MTTLLAYLISIQTMSFMTKYSLCHYLLVIKYHIFTSASILSKCLAVLKIGGTRGLILELSLTREIWQARNERLFNQLSKMAFMVFQSWKHSLA